MKCPVCGKWNRDTNPRCLQCGAELRPEDRPADAEPAWKSRLKDGEHGTAYFRMDTHGESDAEADARDVLAEEMADLKSRKTEGSYRLRSLRGKAVYREAAGRGLDIRGSEGTDTFWQTEDDPVKPATRFAAREARPANESRTAVLSDLRAESGAEWGNTLREDPLWQEQEQYAYSWRTRDESRAEPPPLPRERFLHRLGAMCIGIAAALVLTVVVGSILGLTGALGESGFLGIVLPVNSRSSSADSGVLISATIMDDLAAHTIQIPGEDGQRIFIRELYSTYEVTGGYATIQIQDHTWYDNLESVTEPTMQVTLTPYLTTASGKQEAMAPIHYEIEIPLSPIELITPNGLRTNVASTMYTMEFNVRPGSVVKMNGQDISDTVNYETGDVSYNANVQPVGDNVFTLTCRSQYCRDNTLNIVLYRERQEIPLNLAADTYTSTTLKNLLITCTTLPGAKVDVLSPFTDLDITNLATKGEFSFYAVFDHYGDNIVHIESSYPGKKTSVIEYSIYYVPNVDVYTRSVWSFQDGGYAELVANIDVRAQKTQRYEVKGIIREIISEKPQLAIIYTSADGQSQPAVIRNHTKMVWQVGHYYRVYADVSGKYDNMPQLEVRYSYDK